MTYSARTFIVLFFLFYYVIWHYRFVWWIIFFKLYSYIITWYSFLVLQDLLFQLGNENSRYVISFNFHPHFIPLSLSPFKHARDFQSHSTVDKCASLSQWISPQSLQWVFEKRQADDSVFFITFQIYTWPFYILFLKEKNALWLLLLWYLYLLSSSSTYLHPRQRVAGKFVHCLNRQLLLSLK